jgi:DNA-binding LacI/PurR family transcriptional regulator
MTVTLKDVARHAKVSVQTVSNVVNHRSTHVGAHTRLVVLNAINELQYRPNLAARHLRNAPVGVLAFAIPDLTNAYFSELATLVIKVAATRGYTVLVDHTFADRAQEAMVANGLRPHLIDGLILDPQALRADDLAPTVGSIPAVLLGERLIGRPRDHVAIDNVAAARTIVNHLVHIGRRRIAAIGIQQPIAEMPGGPAMRLQGYAEALAAAGMAQDPRLIEDAYQWSRPYGERAMRKLLTLSEPPDAVFCFNDLMALGAMYAVKSSGLRVPEDVAIAGFDDIEDGQYANPPLTTIAPDKQAIADMAVNLLLARIDGTRTGPSELIVPSFKLVVRESTAGSSAPGVWH